MRRTFSIATWILLWQTLAVVIAVTVSVLAMINGSARDAHVAAVARTDAVAEVMSRSGRIGDALVSGSGSSLNTYLTDLAPLVRVDWISVYDLDGQLVASNSSAAPTLEAEDVQGLVSGRTLGADFTASTGAAVRDVAVVLDSDEQPVGAVDIAMDLDTVAADLGGRIAVVLWGGGIMMVLLGIGAWLLNRYLRRSTGGRGNDELRGMLQFYGAGMRAIGDGIILIDADGRVALINAAARRMLDLPDADSDDEAMRPHRTTPIDLPHDLLTLVSSPPVSAVPLLTATHVLLVDTEPVPELRGIRPRTGTIVTLRDHTELQELIGEVDTSRTLADALASQAHEFSNRLHTIVGLMELERHAEAIEFAAAEVEVSQGLAEQIIGAADDPFLTALLLGKSAQAHERGIRLHVDVEGEWDAGRIPPRDLVTILGNLVDNAFDAAARTPEPAVWVTVAADGSVLDIRVTDSGSGPPPERLEQIFELGASTKESTGRGRGIGLALVRQSAQRWGGTVRVDGSTFRVVIPLSDREKSYRA